MSVMVSGMTLNCIPRDHYYAQNTSIMTIFYIVYMNVCFSSKHEFTEQEGLRVAYLTGVSTE